MTSVRAPSLISALVAFLLAVPGFAQDEEPVKPEKPDPAVAEKLKELDRAVGDRKFEHDGEAVNMIDELQQQYEGMHEKDQRAVLKSLRGVFSAKKRKPDNPGLYVATVFALGKIGGSDAARILVSLVDKAPFEDKDWLSFQEHVLENVGATKDERQVSFLVKKATRGPEDEVKYAAGKALRYFEDLPLDKRQEIFKDLLIDYERIEGDANANLDPGDATVATRKRTLAKIRDAWNGTLGAMSGQACGTAVEWRKWWNDNKDDRKAWK